MNAPDIKKYLNLEHVDTDPAETAEWNEAFMDLLASMATFPPLWLGEKWGYCKL